MNLREFIETIMIFGDLGKQPVKITTDICQYSKITFSKDTIKAWFKTGDGRRTPTYKGTIDRLGFINYFKENTCSTWTNIQTAFRNTNKYDYIDYTTNNPEIFYTSLLKQFYYLLRSAPISLQHIPPAEYEVIGRTQELEKIENVFSNSNIVILNGIGGIGKSLIASAYSKQLNTKEEWTIQHIICDDVNSIQEAILKLKFDNYKEATDTHPERRCDERIELLKNNLKPVLIILDNFDYSPKSKELNILKMDSENFKYRQYIRFIITTRNKWAFYKDNFLYIGTLKEDDLFSLYAKHRFEDCKLHTEYMTKNKEVLNKLFTLVQKHTLMITLLAKLSLESCISETELLSQLSSGLKLPEDTITLSKDKNDFENTIDELLKRIFDISHLTTMEKSIMTYLSLIPIEGLKMDAFCKLANTSRNDVQPLVKKNWITMDEENSRIHLHPLICDTVLNHEDTKPSAELCNTLLKIAAEKRQKYETHNIEWHTYNKIIANILSRIFFSNIRDFKFSHYPNTNLFDILKDEYVDGFLSINQILLEYITSDFSTRK